MVSIGSITKLTIDIYLLLLLKKLQHFLVIYNLRILIENIIKVSVIKYNYNIC